MKNCSLYSSMRCQNCSARRIQLHSSLSTSSGSGCAYHSSVASSNNTSLYDSNSVAVNRSLNASMMTDLYASMIPVSFIVLDNKELYILM